MTVSENEFWVSGSATRSLILSKVHVSAPTQRVTAAPGAFLSHWVELDGVVVSSQRPRRFAC